MESTNTRTRLEQNLRLADTAWDRLPILIELARECLFKDHDFTDQCAREALTLAKSLNDPFWIAMSMRAIGQGLRRTARYSEVISYLEEASRIFMQINDYKRKAQNDLTIATVYTKMGKFDSSLKLLGESFPVFERTNDSYSLIHSLAALGEICRMTGNHTQGLKYYRKAMVIASESGSDHDLCTIYTYLANSYRILKDYDRTLRYYFKTLRICRRTNDKGGIGCTLSNIANVYLDQDLPDQAEKYVRYSLRIYHDCGYVISEAMAWSRLGSIYRVRGDYPKALRCYYKGLTIAKKAEDRPGLGKLYEQIGVLHVAMRSFERGLFYLKRSESIVLKFGDGFFQYEICAQLAWAYEIMGDTANALKYYKESNRRRSEYVTSREYLEAGRVEMQKKIERLTGRLKKERDAKVSLEKQLEAQQAELASLALELVRKEEERKKRTRGKNPSQTNSKNSLPENWDAFARQFHKVHHDFYRDIILRFPTLTPTEVKVCSLIRIGLSSKETAALLCISKRTVDSHRVRIHKKMGLPSGSSLSDFIVKL